MFSFYTLFSLAPRSLVPSPTSALHFIPDGNKMEGGSGAGNETRPIDDRLGRLPRYDALGTGLETEVRANKLVLRC